MMVLLIIGVLIIFFIALSRMRKHQQKQKRLAQLRENWGKVKDEDIDYRLIGLYKDECHADESLPDLLANDLDLGNVFAFIDRTHSRPGQQYLYQRLNSKPAAPADLLELDKKIALLPADQQELETIAIELSELNNRNAYYLPQLFKPQQPAFDNLTSFYIRSAGFIFIGLIVLLITTHSAVFFLALLAAVITNLVIHYSSKSKIFQYTHSLPEVIKLGRLGNWLSKRPELLPEQKVTAALENLGDLKRSLNFVNLDSATGNDPTDLSFVLFELINMTLLLQPLMFIISIAKINRYCNDIRTVYEYVAQSDLLLNIHLLRQSLPVYSKPDFNSDDRLSVTNLYHPLIPDCVANSIDTRAGQGVLITGSNMSGKTTFIRSMAINTLLAQTIYTTCSSGYTAPWLNVFTSIRISDDVEENKSYFQSEALAVLDILQESSAGNNRGLIIIDEIFRGTNTIERIAAAKAVLAYLTSRGHFVFVSTHDLELAELLGDEYAVYSFEESVDTDARLVFDYKIKHGLLKHKNGIAILQSLGYPESVIADAGKVGEQLRAKYGL